MHLRVTTRHHQTLSSGTSREKAKTRIMVMLPRRATEWRRRTVQMLSPSRATSARKRQRHGGLAVLNLPRYILAAQWEAVLHGANRRMEALSIRKIQAQTWVVTGPRRLACCLVWHRRRDE